MADHHQRFHFFQSRKFESEQNALNRKPTNLHLILLLSLFSITLGFLLLLLCSPPYTLYPLLYDYTSQEEQKKEPLCPPSMPNNSILCDRSNFRTDFCYIKGDIRTKASSNSILIPNQTDQEIIKPYPRKWETSIMSKIHQLHLHSSENDLPECDIRHESPAVAFSTGGYTGNVFHEFNEVILPLYVTSRHLNKNVIFIVSQFKNWWMTKYVEILSSLSKYPPIDFKNDTRTHCFPEAIIGLHTHGDLTVKESTKVSIRDFRKLLDQAYSPRFKNSGNRNNSSRPALVILSRNGSRSIENEVDLVKVAEEVGFGVSVLRPDRTTELAKIYHVLNSSDAMVGVHGAAMTHFLFMRPGSIFIQIVPLGTDWAAETYYGDPAVKMGLRYLQYKVLVSESSLSREYNASNPVLQNPESVNGKGWEMTKKVYLERQSVSLDLGRFRKRLRWAYRYLASRTNEGSSDQDCNINVEEIYE